MPKPDAIGPEAEQPLQSQKVHSQLSGVNPPNSYAFQYVTEANGRPRFTYISPDVERVHGVKVVDVLRDADTLRGLVVPELGPALAAAEAGSVRDMTDFEMDVWTKHTDGKPRLIHLWSHPVRSLDGSVLWNGVAVDITDQRRSEKALFERDKRLNLFVENAPAAIAMLDGNMHYMAVSRRWLSDYNLQAANIIGRSHYEIFPEIPDNWKEIHRRCLNGAVEKNDGEPFTRADGSVDWVRWEVRPWHTEEGGVGGIFIFSEVITGKKKREQKIERLTRLYTLLSQVNQAIVRANTRDELFASICRVVVKFGNFQIAWIGWVESGGSSIRCVAHYTEDPAIKFPPQDLAATCGIGMKAVQNGTASFSNNILEDEHMESHHVYAAQFGIHSCAAIPIRFQGRVQGVFELCSKNYGFYNAEEMRLLDEVALDISYALDRLHEQEQHRRAEEALLENRAKLAAALASMTDAVFISDVTGKFIEFNDAFATFHKFNSKEECGKHLTDYAAILDVYTADGKPVPLEQWAVPRALRGDTGTNVEYSLRRKDTGDTWIGSYSFAPIRDKSGAITGSVVVGRDITELRESEGERRRLATALAQAAESILITDIEGNTIYVNPAFERISGYSRKEVLGKNPRVLKSGRQDDAFYRQMWGIIKKGEVWHGHIINRRKDGTLFEEDATITPIRDATGKIVNYMAIKLDVTREMELEAQFRQAQKMEAIGQLAGGVAHDFNNILSAIMMQADLTAMTENISEAVKDGLKEISSSAERAANLTRQLLLFSRRQVMQSRELDLNEVVTSLAKMLQRIIGENVRLRLHLHPAPLTTRADSGMLDQVLINLAVNARDAMPKGGLLTIETSERILDELSAQNHPEAKAGRYVCLSVGDTGCGMAPEIKSRIFEPFFTTKEPGKGTGLGLATVFGIIKQHQGWIKVHSQLDQGTNFQIFLPACDVAPEASVEASRRDPQRGTETILLAEDDPSVRLLTQTTLEAQGYRVLAAANGEEAIRLWREYRSEIALLFTDLVMPGAVNGQQLARRLQEGNPNLKVVFISGYSADIAGGEIELRRGETFLQKPCSLPEIIEAIRLTLDN
jgi:PAS domain S-box-containing protein